MDRAPTQTFSQFERFRAIEVIALWEGDVNASTLQKLFNCSRQIASDSIKNYRQAYPDSLEYDPSRRYFYPTQSFTPKLTQGRLEEYAEIYRTHRVDGHLSLNSTGLCHLETPLRNLRPELVRPIIRAIKEGLRLDIGYQSLNSPSYEERIIAPHTLVFTGLRWHVRAWCEKNQQYRDFVLSRFSGECAFEGPSDHGVEQDQDWNQLLTLTIVPDSRLSEARQRLIALDYCMENSRVTLQVRAALLLYMRQLLRVDRYEEDPEAQQIIIEPECRKALRPYLHD